MQYFVGSRSLGLALPMRSSLVGESELLQTLVGAAEIFWRHWKLFAIVCVGSVIVASIVKSLTPPNYTASLIIQPDFDRRDRPAKASSSLSIDTNTVVESQMQLIQSQVVGRNVVQRLGLDRINTQPSLMERLWEPIGQFLNPHPPSAVDKATASLLRTLRITRQRASYNIGVSYTARTPEEADRILNAVASEFIRTGQVQTLADRLRVAQAALAEIAGRYLDKHPLVQRAKASVASAQDALKEEEEFPKLMNVQELVSTGFVVRAPASTIPIGLGVRDYVLIGLIAGLFLAAATVLFLERDAFMRLRRRERVGPQPVWEYKDGANRTAAE